jgi:hypothetical protein
MNNRMIDLQVSNNKLYYRSIGIIDALTHVGDSAARIALLRAIYLVDQVLPEVGDDVHAFNHCKLVWGAREREREREMEGKERKTYNCYFQMK